MSGNSRSWSPPQIIWSALIAIVVWSAIGFSWFGHGFNWMTERHANEMATDAVVERLARICVAQAHRSPNAAAALEELAALESWKRRDFVESAQWATMPGSDSAHRGVASLCASKLLET